MPASTRKAAPLVLLAVVLVVAAGVVAAYLIASSDESAGPEDGVTLGAIAEEPARYEGETVTISGEYAEHDSLAPEDAALALVLGDDAGEQLLVLPQPSADIPRIDENTVLRVRGTVDVVGDGGSTAAGYLREGGLLEPGMPEPIVRAEQVELIIPPEAVEQSESAPVAATVPQIVRDPEQYAGRALAVSGQVSRIGGRGFTLTQDGASIFVSTAGSGVEDVREGEQVRITADVSRLSEFRARQLAEELGPDAPEPDDPYLLLRTLETDVS